VSPGAGTVRGFALASEAPFVSFDGGVTVTTRLMRPDRYRHLEAPGPEEPRIVRGGGYSYAAAGFGAGALVQDTRAFDRVLAFDDQAGTIECEAGVTLEKLHRLLTPRGFYLPAQPGYPRITLGGCVAADVHGKNQAKDGNFGRSVLGLRLFHPRHGFLDLRPGDEAFELTLGGLGLTGHIVSLRLRLARLPSAVIVTKRTRIADVTETVARLEGAGADAPFLYTWQDFTARGAEFGRGFLYSGRFATDGSASPFHESRYSAIDAASRGRPGFAFFNRWTTPAFNRIYGAAQSWTAAERRLPLFDFLFPVARKVAYFRLFGRRGFHESQFLLARSAFLPFARDLERFLSEHHTPITLASAKLFEGAPRHLRFDGQGICLALDFPRGREAGPLLRFLDDAVTAYGGRPSVMKDSRLGAATVRACYPEYTVFKEALRRFDPARIYRSDVSARLEL
jgi:decaprenylphospho-beta-D-ribofuranose 2-oxidase